MREYLENYLAAVSSNTISTQGYPMMTKELGKIFAEVTRELQWNGVRLRRDFMAALGECLSVIESAPPDSSQYASAVTALNDLTPILEELGAFDTYAWRACDLNELLEAAARSSNSRGARSSQSNLVKLESRAGSSTGTGMIRSRATSAP
jgi:hypothetical protein